MNKSLWIIANWKSNKTLQEGLEWVEQVGPKLPKRENFKVVVCPSFALVEEIHKKVLVGNYPLLVGSQDLSPFPEGAYTGEEAASDISQFVSLAILGHSERRKNFAETDQIIAEKANQAEKAGIIPLVCVQGKDILVPENCKLVAYEPIFAIGTGNADTPADALEVALALKKAHGEKLEVLYGGSVTAENCSSFVKKEQISGLLIGKASLDPEEFSKIVLACFSI